MPETTAIRGTHTVVEGDTLWGIAKAEYGNGSLWPNIYDANQDQIQATAKANDLWDPEDKGHWIFPGQVFDIPR